MVGGWLLADTTPKAHRNHTENTPNPHRNHTGSTPKSCPNLTSTTPQPHLDYEQELLASNQPGGGTTWSHGASSGAGAEGEATQGGGAAAVLFKAYHKLLRVWNHPVLADLEPAATAAATAAAVEKAEQRAKAKADDGFGDFGLGPSSPEKASSAAVEASKVSPTDNDLQEQARGRAATSAGNPRHSAKIVWLLELIAQVRLVLFDGGGSAVQTIESNVNPYPSTLNLNYRLSKK